MNRDREATGRGPGLGLVLLLVLTALLIPSGGTPAQAATLIAPKKVCPNRTANGGKAAMAKARQSMICMVNYARKKKGLRKYHRQRQLTWSAGRKASDILRCGFTHSACGRSFDYWIRRSGYLGGGGWMAGENIAWGSRSLGNVRAIFIAWMKSKGHRDAILSRGFNDVGAGVVRGQFEGIPGARIWVLHFGDH